MKLFLAALVGTSALTQPAYASDKPVIAPAPAWVKPVTPATPSAKPDDAPIRVLLSDQQIALDKGVETVYGETALRIQTPQGLAAGNISIPWRPETDTLTVHKLLIRRGDKVIDVLASGQTFTVVRREQNLESAMLDGVLTANIQPEGLQVGDTLEFAISITSRDPVLKGHVEQLAAAWNGFPVGRAHLRVQWPGTLPLRLRSVGSLPPLKPVRKGDQSTVEITMDGVEPEAATKGAPPRYALGRLIEMTDYAAWSDLGALMAPLYDKAAAIPADGPLRVELDRIKALSPDPKVQAQAALALVQDRVRYVALAMGTGGYVPADAAETWARRYGDCKGKTALLLALLHALDIAADPVAVNTIAGDGMDQRLPMAGLFNHVLVRARIGGRDYWLDGTRTGDTALDRLRVPNFGWGLPLVTQGAALVRMVPPPLEQPTNDVTIRMDASAGIAAPAPTRIETILRGDEAISTNTAMANLTGDARDRALREYWKGEYDFIDVKSATASFDPKTGEERLVMEGLARMDWGGDSYDTDGTAVGYRADFAREGTQDKTAPYAVPYPYFVRTRETIVLPKNNGAFRPSPGIEVDKTVGGIAYRRHATLTDGVFTIERTERSVVPEFSAADAPAAQAALRTLADTPAKLRKPVGYVASDKEMAAVGANTPTTAYEYGQRAALYADRGMREEAIADYTKAIELNPNNVWAMSNRALTRIQMGEIAQAKTDLDQAEKIDPDYIQTIIARAMIADREKRPRDAIALYTKALQHEADNRFALGQRALAYLAIGDSAHAMADRTTAADVAIKQAPDSALSYVERGNVLLDQQRFPDALKAFDQALSLDPKNVWALANRGLTHVWLRQEDAAAKDLDAAQAIDPRNAVVFRARGLLAQQKDAPADAVAAYSKALDTEPGDMFSVNRRAQAYYAMNEDAAALADARAVTAAQPRWVDPYVLRANILRRQGKTADVVAEAEALSAANPGDAYAQVAAANIYIAIGKRADAMKAYDRAIAVGAEPFIYLNRALRRTKDDVAGKRADLDNALRLDPNDEEAIAAKADLLAETGDLPGAIKTYSALLGKKPDEVNALVGRGKAYSRQGDSARAEADFRRARALATDAGWLNNICWNKATAGVALDSALADCNASLAKQPGSLAALDSRGFVYLRLDRLDEAMADYDRALAGNVKMAASLFGRAVVWSRKGDKTKSDADAAKAVELDPNIVKTFENYGIKR
ncbi:tetratricopeptide repeat protein [Sphingomonas sanguinis]|uniref:Tetratricopeptide repeat protein n=1 Tax=Sphingomonas sanguinis TaxID=33051 RepID=A0ABU5LVH5_9SPHN|nr:tetratricopeptide repeat protein [Sphingomonas sanguinis]MDZ7283938.1 tetratricopeptide repeat protein [Sphingomonas sanguinis]